MNKEKLIDLVLRIHFVNNSPGVAGAFIMSWVHGAEYKPGLTFHEQLADLHEELGLPRELSKPEYPETIWAAFKRPEEQSRVRKSKNKGNDANTIITVDSVKKNNFGDHEVFSGTVDEVHNWCQANEGKYDYMGHTNRTVITEQEAFKIWKEKILKENGLLA